MTDNIRQEAVERAAAWLLSNDADDVAIEEAAVGAIDASGLIEQLTEAIAQRDEARRAKDALADEMTATTSAAIADLAKCQEQLATERALCDRLAENLMAVHNATQQDIQRAWDDLWACLRDYDAHRATEHPIPQCPGCSHVEHVGRCCHPIHRATEHSETETP